MGNYLSNRRKALGLTQKQIAELVDVSEATVSRWESGEIANMRRDRIAAYAKALKTTPSFIMSGDEPQAATPAPVVLTAPQSILLAAFNQLNEEGQQKAQDYVDDLVYTGRYKKCAAPGVAAKEA
ncbi:helix-turn-helix domain-containing protein [Faecalibacterium prausnitzii]|uniref:helix-turn-helix domain-containing protein n=1 Tax=Faecalibacterium prausnitzii TaxID=853 RepID=UPI003F1DD54B